MFYRFYQEGEEVLEEREPDEVPSPLTRDRLFTCHVQRRNRDAEAMMTRRNRRMIARTIACGAVIMTVVTT